MLAELVDQHIEITGEFIAELEQYLGAPAPAYLPARITEMKQVFRLANPNFQARYLANFDEAARILPETRDVKHQAAILASLVADLEAHRDYLARKKDKILAGKITRLEDLTGEAAPENYPAHLAHLLSILKEKKDERFGI